MPANFTGLTAAINALAAEVTATQGVTASAIALITGFAAQVTAAVSAALTADDAADQGSIDAANAAIATTLAGFTDARTQLGAAVAAGSPTP